MKYEYLDNPIPATPYAHFPDSYTEMYLNICKYNSIDQTAITDLFEFQRNRQVHCNQSYLSCREDLLVYQHNY